MNRIKRIRWGAIAMAWTSTILVGATAAFGQADFADAVYYDAGPTAQGVRIGDLDGDGDNDLAVVTQEGHLRILFNNGDGTFQPAVPHDDLWESYTVNLAMGDLDRDGDTDLAVAFTSIYGTLSILLNNGDGTFADPDNYDTCYSTQAVVLGDLNGDLLLDTASASNCFSAAILLNNGDGTFTDNGDYGNGYTPGGIDVGDLDGDGDRDAVYTNGTSTLTVLFNDGTGTFGPFTWYQVFDNPRDVKIADLDGDGDNDLVSANVYENHLSVLMNDGTGVFAPAVDYGPGDGGDSLAVSDLDLDGDLDLVTSNRYDDVVRFFYNPGDGTYDTSVDKSAGTGPEGVAVGDLNGDARPDLAVANGESGDVAVYINTTQFAPDQDDDGVTDFADCDPEDASVWRQPASIVDLLAEGRSSTKLSWSPSSSPGSATVTYDVLRSSSPSDFSSATCLESAQSGTTALDSDTLTGAFYYLIRVANGCGGTLGTDSDDVERSGPVCP